MLHFLSYFIVLLAITASVSMPADSLPVKITKFENRNDGVFAIDTDGKSHLTTLDKNLQGHLQNFVKTHGMHSVAAVVVVDAQNGEVKAAIDTGNLEDSQDRPLFYPFFPIASLFKTVISAASFDVLGWQGTSEQDLRGGCGNVQANGVWLRNDRLAKQNSMSVRKAFAQSCNSFFAKLAVEQLGFGLVDEYARKFGWERTVPADFDLPISHITLAQRNGLSVQSVGSMAAGLGRVYTNIFHVAWQYMMIANSGVAKPLKIFKDTAPSVDGVVTLKPSTADRLREVMPDVVSSRGTAADAFNHRKYRTLRQSVGGKTGTLSGVEPKGVNTWFAGMMPIDNPRYVVASVVVINDLWHIRGPDLAAEAFWALKYPKQISDIAQK